MTRKEELKAELEGMDKTKSDLERSIEDTKMRLHFLRKRRKLVQEEFESQPDEHTEQEPPLAEE